MVQHVVVQRRGDLGHVANRWFDLHDIDPLDDRLMSHPPRRLPRPQPDDQAAFWPRMQQHTQRAQHDLRPDIAHRVAVAFAIHDKSDASVGADCDTRFAAIGLPNDVAALSIHPGPQLIGRLGRLAGSSRANPAVPPNCSRADRE